MELKVGDRAPNFEAKLDDGSKVKLSDYRGKKLILYFYPTDDTPTCTDEACNLRDNFASLKKEGFEILGVSPDSEEDHQKFINKFNLPFKLVSDPDLKVHHLYNTWAEKQMFGNKFMGTLRHTYIIDEEGVIKRIIKKVKSKDHSNQILN